jgi:hypothetical protein
LFEIKISRFRKMFITATIRNARNWKAQGPVRPICACVVMGEMEPQHDNTAKMLR